MEILGDKPAKPSGTWWLDKYLETKGTRLQSNNSIVHHSAHSASGLSTHELYNCNSGNNSNSNSTSNSNKDMR